MELGERMLRYRAKHRLTQSQLASEMGETLQTIHRCESGKQKPHKANEIRLSMKLEALEAKDSEAK